MSRILLPTKDNLAHCARAIRENQLVVFPTETVYGLGGNAFSKTAVEKIFRVKHRPKKNPVIVHVSSLSMLSKVIGRPLSKKEKKLLSFFWPGPLTVLFPKSDRIPLNVTAGLSNVAVRMPSNPIARKLISLSGVPIAAPSANKATRPSSTLSRHAKNLRGVFAILEGGPSVFGIESTVLDLKNQEILRPGPVGISELKPFLPKIRFHSSLRKNQAVKNPASPGMRYVHYAPHCRVVLLMGSFQKQFRFLDSKLKSAHFASKKIAVICSDKIAKKLVSKSIVKRVEKKKFPVRVFSFSSARSLAKNLFRFFHELDEQNFKTVFVQGVPERGIGFSVMNRLKKASSKQIQV